jgi:hypothetical protein
LIGEPADLIWLLLASDRKMPATFLPVLARLAGLPASTLRGIRERLARLEHERSLKAV